MNKIVKTFGVVLLVALISVGATVGTYYYLNNNSPIFSGSSEYKNYGEAFNQKNLQLASLTAEGYPDFTKAAENSINAVVHIKSTIKAQASSSRQRVIDPFDFFFGFGDRGQQMEPQPSVGFGSGVIISKDGYIITNNHVIDKANDIEVTLNDNSKYTAKLIGTDPNTDIALIKIEGKEFHYVPFGDSDNLKVGEWVLAIGNPFNLTSTVTAGIVSAKGRGGISPGADGNMQIQSFIQTDAAINRGNSGGALVNTQGQLIGINTAIYSQTGDFAGYGFAVPISIAGKVAADLKEYGTVQRAMLGVSIQDISVMKESKPEQTKGIEINEGVYVGGFSDRSAAKESGVEEGDVITAVNGVKTRGVGELQDQISRHRPGDKVKLAIKRGKTDKTIEVTLKNATGNTSIVKKTDGIANAGAAFKELSAEKKKQYGISFGVEVAGVDNDGKFKKGGVSKGFIILKINNQAVSSPEEVEKIIDTVGKSNDKVLFIAGFYPNGRTTYYAIDLQE